MGLVNLDQLPDLNLAEGIVVRAVAGELELTVKGVPHLLVPGKVMVLPSNVPYSGRAVRDCYVVDVFHRVREDWRS